MSVDGQQQAWQSEEHVEGWVDSQAPDESHRRSHLRVAASLLPLTRTEPIRVLDIGSGHGELAGQVLEEFPNATVCVHDFSEPMLAKARTRLAQHDARVEYHISDLREPDWAAGLTSPFDAVVSSRAVHNLVLGDMIRAVYAAVHDLLRPGGWFFNLDFVLDVMCMPEDAPQVAIYSQILPHWADHERPIVPGVPGLTDHLGWLTEIGFEGVDCLRKDLSEVFLIARRPA